MEENIYNLEEETDPRVKAFFKTIYKKMGEKSPELLALAPGAASVMSGDLEMVLYFDGRKCRLKNPNNWKYNLVLNLIRYDIIGIPFGSIKKSCGSFPKFAKSELALSKDDEWYEKPRRILKPKKSEEESLDFMLDPNPGEVYFPALADITA